MTQIDVTDRGLTVSKSLAWTMVVGLIGAALSFGWSMPESRTLYTDTGGVTVPRHRASAGPLLERLKGA